MFLFCFFFKEENHPPEGEKEEPLVAPAVEESLKSSTDNFQERRALAIAAKAQEIEKVPTHPSCDILNLPLADLFFFFNWKEF